MGCIGSKNKNQGIILSCTPNICAPQVNNRGIQMKGTLPHTQTQMENPGSREEHDAEEALPENENITEVVQFLSENESFYSAEDSVSENEALTLEGPETAGDALKH